MNFCKYAKKLSVLTGMVVVFFIASLLLDDSGTVTFGFTSAAFAKDGDGGNDGDGGSSGSDDGDSGNSGRGRGRGRGRSGSNSGSDSGKGKSGADYSDQDYTDQGGGGDGQGQATPETIIRHVNGWIEGVISGTYFVRDNKNRTVIERPAKPVDVERINRQNDR